MRKPLLFLFLVLGFLFLTYWFFSPSADLVAVDLKINRFGEEVFLLNAENINEKTNKWDSVFGEFPHIYTTHILNISHLDTKKYYNDLLAFTSNKDMREAYDSTAFLFEDISDICKDLEIAFGRFSDYFPNFPIPDITFFFGGFNYAVASFDDDIAIGLENFLGKNSKFYQLLGVPEYLRFQKQKKFILSNVMEVWFDEHFQKYLVERDFLSQLVYKGKMMYFLDHVLPDISIEDKFRFTNHQMDWVIENELSIWEYFIHEDLLFSSKESKYMSFVNYAPFAKGMPNGAPGRVGYYIGYKMVCDYMSNNKVDIEQMIYLTDTQNFIKKSKYKPEK